MSEPGNKGRIYARIAGTGSYLPEKVLTNDDLAKLVDTSDEWIQSRTGIRERHIAAEGQTAGDLGYQAALRALEAAGVDASDIDLIVVGTTTPDLIFPSTACLIQARLGATGCAAMDVNAACSGFIYALSVAEKFIRCGDAKTALVIGTETLSRIVDWTERTTCVLFGDGAGAAVLKADTETLQANGLDKHDLDWLIPHQANLRIIEATAKRLDMSMDQVIVTVDKHGNTSSGSVPLALDTAIRSGRVERGQLLLLEAFGGGFTWGSVLLRY